MLSLLPGSRSLHSSQHDSCTPADDDPVLRPSRMLVSINRTPLCQHNLPHNVLTRRRQNLISAPKAYRSPVPCQSSFAVRDFPAADAFNDSDAPFFADINRIICIDDRDIFQLIRHNNAAAATVDDQRIVAVILRLPGILFQKSVLLLRGSSRLPISCQTNPAFTTMQRVVSSSTVCFNRLTRDYLLQDLLFGKRYVCLFRSAYPQTHAHTLQGSPGNAA